MKESLNYKKGKILTLGELKSLPKNSVIHLWYKDENNQLRNNDFAIYCGYEEGDNELSTMDGWALPIDGHKDDELIIEFDNSDWKFTVRKAILK